MAAGPPRLLFRGLRALIWHADDRNRQALEHYLRRLGLSATVHADDTSLTDSQAHDLLFFDGDRDLPLPPGRQRVPRIALVGSEAPSRLEWLLNQEPASLLVKPIRPAGIYAAIAFAFATFDRRSAIECNLDRLEAKVRHRRFVVFAVLRLMRHHGYSEQEAFAHLRRTAMAQRTTIEALSAELVARDEPRAAAQ